MKTKESLNLVGWCLTCQKLEPVMLDAYRRRPACTVPQPERRAPLAS